MERRNTIQREMVLNTVRTLGCHATADEVYSQVIKTYPSISRGTVYRNLNILVDENQIMRIEFPGNPDRFDHNMKEHLHVQCVKCRKLIDVEFSNELGIINNLKVPKGMQILGYKILFHGVCSDCIADSEEQLC